jgi:hypothetical protein
MEGPVIRCPILSLRCFRVVLLDGFARHSLIVLFSVESWGLSNFEGCSLRNFAATLLKKLPDLPPH